MGDEASSNLSPRHGEEPRHEAEPRHGKRWLAAGLLLGGLALAAGLGWYVWHRTAPLEPPAIDLTSVDPVVAEAVRAAREEVRRSPRSAAAWGRLGMVLLAHDFAADSNVCFAQAGRLDPHDPRWLYLRALPLLLKEPEKALPLLEQAVELCETETAPRLRLGEELLARGRFDEAEQHFRRVLGQDPGHPRANLGLGRVAFQRGDLQASLDHLRRSAAVAPGVRPTHLLLAEVHQRLGDRAAAERELRRAAELPDSLVWPDPYIEEVEELGVGVEARVSFADHLIDQGRAPQAIYVLQEAVRDYPDSYRAYRALGRALIHVKDFVAAERALRQAVRLNPDGLDAQFDLGVSLHQQANHREAAACYLRALALKPHHAEAFYNLGLCRKQLGDQHGALEALRNGVRYKPHFAPGQRELGKLLAQMGRIAEALVHLEHAARLAPSDEEARKWLEYVRGRAGPPDRP